uniref:Genome polyprotein n=1 Tax=Pow Burn virus TaxID=1807805 RepID=A0A140HEQ0_9VIRU|nr:putative polyprotein [Pow Burn virus]
MSYISADDIIARIEDNTSIERNFNFLLCVESKRSFSEFTQVLKSIWPYEEIELYHDLIRELKERYVQVDDPRSYRLSFELACLSALIVVEVCYDLGEDYEATADLPEVLGNVTIEDVVGKAKHYINYPPFVAFCENMLSLLNDSLPEHTYDFEDLVEMRKILLRGLKIVGCWLAEKRYDMSNETVEFVAEGDSEYIETNDFEVDGLLLPNQSVNVDLSKMSPEVAQLIADEIVEGDDWFDYTNNVHIITNRFCHHKSIKCPCMYSCRHKRLERPSKHNGYEIDETSFRDMCAILSELPTGLYADPLEHYKDHFVVKICLTTADKNIHSAGSRTKEEIMKIVYRIRGFYVETIPDVKRYKYEQFVAEEESDSFITTIINKLKELGKRACIVTSDVCEFIMSTFGKLITSITNFLSDKISKMVQYFFEKLAKLVVSQFDVEALIKHHALKLKEMTTARTIGLACIFIFIVLAVDMICIFSFRMAKRVVDTIANTLFKDNSVFDLEDTSAPKLVTEGMGPLAAIATITCAGVGLATGQTDVIKKKCDFITSVMRAGTGLSLLAGTAFVVMPLVFKDSLTMAWGTPEEKDQLICEDWIIKTTCITRLAKIAKVLASEEMRLWVKEQINEIPALLKMIKTPNYKATILKLYSDLMKISANLEQYHNNSGRTRDVPYSIHLAAEPGFGKSLLSPMLIQQAFGYNPSAIYTRNQTEEYWSGYIAQPVIFIDEFLCNKEGQVLNRSADEYLKLISPTKFVPDFASVDNVTTGLKGTPVNPDIVVTANNSVYMHVNGFQTDAIDRRRRFVILCRRNPTTRQLWKGKNQIDVGGMTDEQLANAEWLVFDIKSPMSSHPITKHIGLTFKELIQFLRDDRESQLSDNAKLRAILFDDQPLEEDPTAKLIEMMAEMKGAPRGKINCDNAFTTFFSMGAKFFSEGNKHKVHKKKRDSCPSQNPDIVGSSDSEDPEMVEANVEVHTPPIDKDETASENYCSVEDVTDDEQPRISNRDILTSMYCTNVDRNRMHRHICLSCDRHTAIKKCEGELFTRCANCVKDNIPINPSTLRSQVLLEPLVFTDEEIEAMRTRRQNDLQRLLVESRFEVLYMSRLDYTFWEEIGGQRYTTDNIKSMGQNLKKRAMVIGVLIGVYATVVFIRRLIDHKKAKTESPIIEFIPESARRDKTTTTRKPYRVRAVNAYGEANKYIGIRYQLTIDGNKLSIQNGFPVCASKFITHRHSLLDSNGEIHHRGEITVFYKDNSDTVPFSLQMVRQLSLNDEISDLAMICLPPKMKINGFPNTVSKFWRDEDLSKFNSGDVCILQSDGNAVTCRANITNGRSYQHGKKNYRLSHALTYCGVGNGPGWCGLMLESYGQICPGMYVGMHVAGSAVRGSNDGLYGLSMPITQEMLMRMIEYQDESDTPTDVDFVAENSPFYGPGLVSDEVLPPNERIMLTRVSKIRKSAIQDLVDFPPLKHLPLLSPRDPRSNGEDPLLNMINDTLSTETPNIDKKIADLAVMGTFHSLKQNMATIFPMRRLTFEEAVGGVPGLLTSINRKTSCGYPLCKITSGKGKSEFFWFDESGKLEYSPVYREMVERFVENFDNGKCEKGRFVSYLKDELVSEKKIKQKRCRVIYGGDLIANTAFRMIFGAFVINYNSSYDKLSHVVGLNQYSYDMDSIYSYLIQVGENFVAGDFSGWDKRMNPYLQEKVYFGIMKHCAKLIHPKNYQSFYEHQVKSPVVIERHLLHFMHTQFSGCFFTTILNCLVHDSMLRYIFIKANKSANLNLDFDTNVRAKILGDDHIYSFSDEAAVIMKPLKIQELYGEIGAVYTDDLKNDEVDSEFRKFTDLTFLGAHPIKHNGKWIGALKKNTIREMVLWTRSHNEDLLDRCQTSIEMSSAWGQDFYLTHVTNISDALRRVNIEGLNCKPWALMIEEVVNRTAASQLTYPRFIAEGNNEGLVNLNAPDRVVGDGLNKTTLIGKLRNLAVAEVKQDLNFGLESTVYRASFEWTPEQVVGTSIAKIDVPFGLLGLGDEDNVQNMPFDRFLMWNGDVKVVLQVNGTPFMCGLLAVYFMPLADYECESANITTTNHVFIQPDKNNTVELNIPYVYLRSVMNTVARTTESLGTIFATPLSRLSSIDGTPVTVSVYSSFPNSKFSIPRPLPVTTARTIKYYSPSGQSDSYDVVPPHTTFQTEGAGQSTSITNNYNNVGGSMPIEANNSCSPDLDFAADVTADMKIPVGLDNPPLASGAVPVEFAYPGFSNSYGVRPTRDMQLMPATFSRQQCVIFDPAETRFDVNCGRMCLLTTIPVSTTQVVNTSLMEISLDSRLNVAAGNNIPINLAVLNQFFFWRGDIELTFAMVRTHYHSCRIQGVVAYGVNTVSPGSRSVAYSNIMDFSGENSVSTMTIEFNAQTEFLRTYEGQNAIDSTQNHSLGTFGLYIVNQLVAPDTVPSTVDLLVFVRFKEVKVAVPRGFSPFTWNGYGELDSTATLSAKFAAVINANASSNGASTEVWNSGFLPMALTGDDLTNLPDGLYTATGDIRFILPNTSIITVNQIIKVTRQASIVYGIRGNNYFKVGDNLVNLNGSGNRIWNTTNFTVNSGTLTVYATPPTFLAEGAEEGMGDGLENAVVTLDHVESSTTTAPAEQRPNIPHKCEYLAKFEFCPTDIVEVGRRYARIEFLTNPTLDQSVLTSLLIRNNAPTEELIHVSTQISSMWRGLYAAWAGSIKYRFYTSDSDVLELFFQPYFNADNQFGMSVGDVISGAVAEIGNQNITSEISVVGPYAREMGFPSWHRQYVDVSIPFQSHLNFLYTSKTQTIAPISSGTLTINAGTAADTLRVYSAFGDDMRLGIYRPPRTTTLSLSAFTNGVNGYWAGV